VLKSSYLSLIEKLLDGHVRESTAAMDCLEELSGKRMAIVVVGPNVTAVLSADQDKLRFERAGDDDEVDATITGTPMALLAAMRGDGLDGFGSEQLKISGDAQVAEVFSLLLRHARPDLEEQLSHLTGDVLAHRFGSVVRDIGAWGNQAFTAVLANSSEFLQEESRQVPARVEIERFYTEIESLRESADRISARIERMLASANRG
jgi:ubiquinone biosynthesis protein UbiJ